MISSFYIKNFRLFNELKIKKIGRVNLIVGKNNSGKTALLEALYVFLTGANQEYLFELLGKRGEDWALEGVDVVAEDVVRHLFFGHQLPSVNDKGIQLSELTKAGNVAKNSLVELATSFEINEFGEEGLRSYFSTEEVEGESASLVLLIKKASDTVGSINLEEDFNRHSRMHRRMLLRHRSVKRKAIQFVTTEFAENEKVSTLWDAISLTGYEKDVIEGLKLIEPKIEGVTFVESEVSRGRIPLIKLKGSEERLPLKSMGDGAFRVFFMILSLVNAKNSSLMIDEFENGLHWSVQKKIWEVIFSLSETLNVQVFATTHSRDCTNAFAQVWSEHVEKGAFHRLDYKKAEHLVVSYDLETLADSMEMDVEVR